MILPNEDAAEFAAFAQAIESQMNPHGELERALVLRIIGLLWRLRRAGKLEGAILYWQQCFVETDQLTSAEATSILLYSPNGKEYIHNYELRYYARENAKKTGYGDTATLGEAYIRGENSLAKLSRYESAIQRNLLRMLHELQRLQAARAGEHVPPPQAVDIDVTGMPEPTPVDDQLPPEK